MPPSHVLPISHIVRQAALQGFSDPAPFASKVLRIRYLFRGRMHYAEIPDYLPVVLPLSGQVFPWMYLTSYSCHSTISNLYPQIIWSMDKQRSEHWFHDLRWPFQGIMQRSGFFLMNYGLHNC